MCCRINFEADWDALAAKREFWEDSSDEREAALKARDEARGSLARLCGAMIFQVLVAWSLSRAIGAQSRRNGRVVEVEWVVMRCC